jgi:Tfp pilus assembly protein PilO
MTPRSTSLRRRRHSWLVTLPLVGATLAFFFLLYLPEKHRIAELHNELREKQAFLAQSNALAATLRRTLDVRRTIDEFLGQWQAQAQPAARSRLLADMTAAARQHQLRTTLFAPSAPVLRQRLAQLPVRWELEGTFGQIHALLATLEQLSPHLWIDELRLQRGSADHAALRAELNLLIFGDRSGYSD